MRMGELPGPGSSGPVAARPSALERPTLGATSAAHVASRASEHVHQNFQEQSLPRLLGVMRRAGEAEAAPGSPTSGSQATPPACAAEEVTSKLPRSAGLFKRVRHILEFLAD